MKLNILIKLRLIGAILGLSWFVVVAACGNYKAPVTEEPTRHIDEHLVGEWVEQSGTVTIRVRPLNDSVYVISYLGVLFRAYHSDVGGVSFITAQELETPERNYLYLNYSLSNDGRTLHLRVVSDRVVPEDLKDSATVQKLLKENQSNPLLFANEGKFTKAR